MKNKKRTFLIMSFVIIILLAACGKGAANVETNLPTEEMIPTMASVTELPDIQPVDTEPPAAEPPASESSPVEIPEGAELLSKEEVDTLTQLFTQQVGAGEPTNWYNMAMFGSYETPQQINLNDLFSMGEGNHQWTPTESETAFLKTQEHIGKWGSTYCISRQTMDDVLQQYFGLTLDETEGVGLENMAYFPETDCYYWSVSDVRYTLGFEITQACRTAEGNIVFYYNIPYREYRMTIKPVGDGYHILSNIWLDDWT